MTIFDVSDPMNFEIRNNVLDYHQHVQAMEEIHVEAKEEDTAEMVEQEYAEDLTLSENASEGIGLLSQIASLLFRHGKV